MDFDSTERVVADFLIRNMQTLFVPADLSTNNCTIVTYRQYRWINVNSAPWLHWHTMLLLYFMCIDHLDFFKALVAQGPLASSKLPPTPNITAPLGGCNVWCISLHHNGHICSIDIVNGCNVTNIFFNGFRIIKMSSFKIRLTRNLPKKISYSCDKMILSDLGLQSSFCMTAIWPQ